MRKNELIDEEYVFGVDLDGVCADFYSAVRKLAAEWKGVPINDLTDNISYGLSEWEFGSQDPYEDFHRFCLTQRNLFEDLKPTHKCAVSLRNLSKHGIRIRIITHRLFIPYFHEKAVVQTVRWLDHYGIPYWDLCFIKNKIDLGANIYIEDTVKNIKAYIKAQQKVIIYTNPTNISFKENTRNVKRVNSWDEVYKIVLDDYMACKDIDKNSDWKKELHLIQEKLR